MDYAKFFQRVRSDARVGAPRLAQVQVDVAELLVEACAKKGLILDAAAYVLATAWGEAKMQPVRENLNYSAERITQVWPSRFQSVVDARPFARRPQALANQVYNGRLGNREGSDDGWVYRGGGLDQLTGRDNYRKRGLAHAPDTILDPSVAVDSIITGMTTGDYRGDKLSDFFRPGQSNFAGARRIINSDAATNGLRYARYGEAFRDALTAAGYKPVTALTAKPVQRGMFGLLSDLMAAMFRWLKG